MAMFEACLHGAEERASADRGYDYPRLREHLADHGVEDWIAVKKKPGHPLSDWLAHLNHAIACMRPRAAALPRTRHSSTRSLRSRICGWHDEL